MNKAAKTVDILKYSRSAFTLTFAIEIINQEIWTDHKEGWVELGSYLQGIKLQYSLFYGQNFDVDISVLEQVAKISCGQEYCWVRTWQFLERRWLTFSIRHAFPVRVVELKGFEATVKVTAGSGTSAFSKDAKVYFVPLDFGQRRYFGDVVETLPTEQENFQNWITEWIWNLVIEYIPASCLDGLFNVPQTVSDIRHQDTIIYAIQENTLNRPINSPAEEAQGISQKTIIDKKAKEKPNKKGPESKFFGLRLPGNRILAGTGRIVPFEPFGEQPPELGNVIVLLSTGNLPAQEDDPIVFINIGRLFDAPLDEFKKLNITHLYTRWTLGGEVHHSEQVEIESIKQLDVNFSDHYAIPLHPTSVTETTATFMDGPYDVQLRGVKFNPKITNHKLFGYDKDDRDFGRRNERIKKAKLEEELECIIAITKIDARALAKGINSFINGEYSLYPPRPSVFPLSRQGACTNDINLIRVPVLPELIVPTSLVLTAQMTLEVSIGVVGCRPPKMISCFSRLFCIISDSNSVMAILLSVRKINDELANIKPATMLTGFALDTGDAVILFVEGPRDGNILKIWDMTEEFYPRVKPVFSTSARFTTRIYPEFLEAIMPFVVLKTYAPLSLMLACPSVYARPALPLPTRIAALKFGRLLQQRFRSLPPRCELPTAAELRSFRLELCAPPRTYPISHTVHEKASQPHAENRVSTESCHSQRCRATPKRNSLTAKINWEKE